MEIKDLTGLSAPLKKLIEVLSSGIGRLSEPYLIRKVADAKAYEIESIANAIKDNQSDLANINFTENAVSLESLPLSHEPSIHERTKNRIKFKEEKRQRNIESVTQKTVANLHAEDPVSDEPVDEDWSARFFSHVEDISNEEMQELWARILSGEIKEPKSFSLRTLDTLRNLSQEDANIFKKFASLAIKGEDCYFLLNFAGEKLLEEKYQLKFKERLLLEELGLLTANDLNYNIARTEDFQKKNVLIIGDTVLIQEKLKNRPEQTVPILAFTSTGQELLKLIETDVEINYLQLISKKLNPENGKVLYGEIIGMSNSEVSFTSLKEVPVSKA